MLLIFYLYFTYIIQNIFIIQNTIVAEYEAPIDALSRKCGN